ncbi:MAG: XRE family transcriptional regulator [Bacteroidia bacterium]|nr:XRE family transcriptional regulator [Bacteroidia bacterium]
MTQMIGQRVKEELEAQERSVTWFARKLNCNRVNVYDIFKRSDINLSLLQRISVILHRNFLREYADEVEKEL